MEDKPSDKKLWVPGQKLPDRVKAIALQLFIELWKTPPTQWGTDEGQYRRALEAAQVVYKVENEEIKKDEGAQPPS